MLSYFTKRQMTLEFATGLFKYFYDNFYEEWSILNVTELFSSPETNFKEIPHFPFVKSKEFLYLYPKNHATEEQSPVKLNQ
jgi:hypothetical protein